MKRIFLTVFSIFYTCIFTLFGQSQWDYPVKPGTTEWATLKTGEQMFQACQIPLDVLNTVSTKELVMLCLNYPLLNEYVAFDDERKGVNLMIDEFNGLRELSQREDGTRELIRVYADYPVLSQVQKDVSSKDYSPAV